MIFYTLPWSRWNRTDKYVRCTVRDSRIRSEMLEAASTLKYEPLNCFITVHSVWIMKIFNVMLLNTCSRNKRRKISEESRWRSQNADVQPSAMLRLTDAKISLVPKHQLIVPLILFAIATNIRTYKATKIHTITPLTNELFFKNSSKTIILIYPT